jgi:hypothetical protein
VSKLIHLFKDPFWAVNRIREKYFIVPEYNRKHQASFSKLLFDLKFDFNDFLEISDEFIRYSELHEFVNQQYKDKKINKSYPPERYSWPVLLYFLVRKTKPETLIETGCWHGNSSVCILAALAKNRKGSLFTIDLPAYFETGGYYDVNPYLAEDKRTCCLPEGTGPGFLVPEFLREKWQLILGPTSEKLPPLIEKLGNIGMFIHDSLHTYDNMKFEFNIAYEHLKKGGFLVSDNIDWNSFFDDFSNGKRSFSYLAYYESSLLKHNFGLIVRE